jgi:serine/threonine-protein kinase
MPARFGKYTLIRRLASGGMAELFLAIQKSVAGFEKLLVIKRILPSMNHDRAFVDMLLHEARVAATLSHPNIVQIFDVGQENGQYFIAMEHVHGEDLRSIVRQMMKTQVLEFPLEHALAIVLGICAGLSYAHEKRDLDGTALNIVHRDISPQNVVVTFTGDVKIVDFGIAKSSTRSGEATKGGKLKGKVPYMSPEQARGEDIDARSDIFSTGVVLFELTTGRRLFKGQSEYETLKLICERDYPRPSDIRSDYPEDLEPIVMKALAKDPAARYQSARELQADLEAFVRRHRIAVSSLALHQFMQGLFEQKLAEQKEALLQGKQLADIIEMQHAARASAPPDASLALGAIESGDVALARGDGQERATSLQRATSTHSMTAASRTVTDVSARVRAGGAPPALLVVGALAGLALVGGGIGWLFARQGAADDARAATSAATTSSATAPTKGTLVIESEPPSASVWINGDLRPETTPSTIGQLPTGVPLDVKVTKDGFEHAKELVTLDGTTTTKVRVALKRGSVVLDVRLSPDGVPATLLLDGKPVTGTRIEGVASGVSHKLVASAPGFAESAVTFTGAPLETKQLDVKLERLPEPRHVRTGGARPTVVPASAPVGSGKLNVGASGGWCNVTVDGVARGATPVAGIELSAGPHKVICTTAEGKTHAASVVVPADGTARHKFGL